jgi:ribose transport system ATP-binding protein
MLGAGRTELLRAIFGADGFDEGEIIVGGETVKAATPEKMKKLGLAFTPENRKEEGLIHILNIRENICLAGMEQIAAAGVITKARERIFVKRQVENLDINAADCERSVSALSGGNQQKVVVGNWLNTSPRVILFDEPTRGIDVGAKGQIFQIMWDLSRAGISSIFVSSELEELPEVCHRILIMKKGRITGEVRAEETSANKLLTLCMAGGETNLDTN